MDNATKRISEFVRNKGFNLSDMSRKTGIPYGALYTSLCNEARDRDLKADEFLNICRFLEKDPMEFMCTEESAGEGR